MLSVERRTELHGSMISYLKKKNKKKKKKNLKKYQQKTITKPFQCYNGENKFKDTLKKFPTHTQTKQKEKFYYTR